MSNNDLMLILMMGSLFILFAYFVGKRVGQYEVMKGINIEIAPIMGDINDILGQSKDQREQYIYAVMQMDSNKGEIPTREVYDIIYKSHLKNDRVYCTCGDSDTCDVFKVLRDYRTKYKHMFSEEELSRKDGL